MLKAVFNSASNSTAYGLPNLVKSKRMFHKLMWLFFIILSVSASVWYIIDTISDYLDYEVVSVAKNVFEQPIQYPTISFCSYNFKSFEKKNQDIFPIEFP